MVTILKSWYTSWREVTLSEGNSFRRRYGRTHLSGPDHCGPDKKLQPEAEVSFVGTRQGLEKDIIPRYGYKLQFIEVAGFKRSLSLDTLRSAAKLFAGLYDAYKIISNENLTW